MIPLCTKIKIFCIYDYYTKYDYDIMSECKFWNMLNRYHILNIIAQSHSVILISIKMKIQILKAFTVYSGRSNMVLTNWLNREKHTKLIKHQKFEKKS